MYTMHIFILKMFQFRRLLIVRQITITTMLEELEDKGIIEPSTPTLLSPLVLVKKTNGDKRPRPDELVEKAAGRNIIHH